MPKIKFLPWAQVWAPVLACSRKVAIVGRQREKRVNELIFLVLFCGSRYTMEWCCMLWSYKQNYINSCDMTFQATLVKLHAVEGLRGANFEHS